jgi:hypothetical protein
MPVGSFMCIVILVIGVLTLAWIMHGLSGGQGQGGSCCFGTETRCPHCRHRNPTHARYCAQCGQKLA